MYLSKSAKPSVKKAFHKGLLSGFGQTYTAKQGSSKPVVINEAFRAKENAALTAAYAASPAGTQAAANEAHYLAAYGFKPGQAQPWHLAQQQALQQPFMDAQKLRKRKSLARGRVALHTRIAGARGRLAKQTDPNTVPGQTPAMAPSILPAFGGGPSRRPGPTQRAAISRLVR